MNDAANAVPATPDTGYFPGVEQQQAVRTQVTAQQASALISALRMVRDSASHAALRLANAGFGEHLLWARMDALEAEMKASLDRLDPALFL